MARKNFSYLSIKSRSDPESNAALTADEANWMSMNWGKCPDCGNKLKVEQQNFSCSSCFSAFNIGKTAMLTTTRLGKTNDS